MAATASRAAGARRTKAAAAAGSTLALPLALLLAVAARPAGAIGRTRPFGIATMRRIPSSFRTTRSFPRTPRSSSSAAGTSSSARGGRGGSATSRVRVRCVPPVPSPLPHGGKCGTSFVPAGRPSGRSARISIFLRATPPSPPENYRASAARIATSSSDVASSDDSAGSSHPPPPPPSGSYPSWWPASKSIDHRIALADHVAHVVVPDVASVDGEAPTCEEVVRWVLRAAADREGNRKRDEAEGGRTAGPGSGGAAAVGIASGTAVETAAGTIVEIAEDDEESRRIRILSEWDAGEAASSPARVLDAAYRHDPSSYPLSPDGPILTATELLALGSVWRLPRSAAEGSKGAVDRFDPSSGVKPTRLTVGDRNATAEAGDYFRVHFEPRRFYDANSYDWGAADGALGGDGEPGVVVARDDEAGYLILNKPPNVPVHARVDNSLENVASCVGRTLWKERKEREEASTRGASDVVSREANCNEPRDHDDEAGARRGRRKRQKKQKAEPLVYVATPQRLDQNTSGLLAVATKKSFASYFAKLLRTKTSGQLRQRSRSPSLPQYTSSCGVHKSYRCLVCIAPGTDDGNNGPVPSMAGEVERLKRFERDGATMRHFLEPSIRAPKRFVPEVPDDAEDPDAWAECLLRITRVGEPCTVVGNDASDSLARGLWGEYGKPDGCVAVAEVEVELLTGRTHQIRGQLCAENFPLVGDAQYGGAVPSTSSSRKEQCRGRAESFLDSERLALQCCSLEFLRPRLVEDDGDGSGEAKRSDTWISFQLEGASWTPLVDRYRSESAKVDPSEATSSLDAEAPLLERAADDPVSSPQCESASCELPPRVLLSKGSHKYVVIRATLKIGGDEDLWFVRSDSPEECGGPYHANVAEKITTQLKALGYATTIMGGGRIDYLEDEEVSHAHVFGFSYGFGKGDHEKVAHLIEEHTQAIATFDDSDGLY
ncbi:hypothetical protein ACHAWF_018537 [Thalassiosira exigua]